MNPDTYFLSQLLHSGKGWPCLDRFLDRNPKLSVWNLETPKAWLSRLWLWPEHDASLALAMGQRHPRATPKSWIACVSP